MMDIVLIIGPDQIQNFLVNFLMLTGQRWLEGLLNEHSTRFYNQLGMKKHVFCRLLSVLQVGSGLCDTKT